MNLLIQDPADYKADDEDTAKLFEQVNVELKKKKSGHNHSIMRAESEIPIQHLLNPSESGTSLFNNEIPQKITVDPQEIIILVSFSLPYKVVRDPKDRTKIQLMPCFHNPSFLYGSLEKMIRDKKYNFKWIGLLTMDDSLTEAE